MPKFSEWLFGSPDKLKKIPTGTQQQQQLHNDILSRAMGMNQNQQGHDLANQYYNNLLGGNQQQAFGNFSAPYLQQFNEQMLPQIAERFAGMGALSSSGFGQALGGASSGLQAELAKLFSQLQEHAAGQQYNQYNQEQNNQNQLTQMGLNYQPFAYQHQQGSQGAAGPLLSGLVSAMAGPAGAGAASGIQQLFKHLFPGGGMGGGGARSGNVGGIGSNTGQYGLPTFMGY